MTARKRDKNPKKKRSVKRDPTPKKPKISKDWVAIGVLALTLAIVHGGSILEGGFYPSGDVIDDIVNNQQIDLYQQESGEMAYWNPYVWGGVPNLFSEAKSLISPDYYLGLLESWLGLPFVFFLLGGIGMYLLLRQWKLEPLLAFFGALLFVSAPYYQSLITVGHDNKFQDIMLAPWVLWCLFLVLEKGRWLHVLLLGLAVALQIRAGHFQIVFYTGFVMVFVVAFEWVRLLRTGQARTALSLLGRLSAAAVISLLVSAQPLLTTSTYAKQSLRGQTVTNLSAPRDEAQDGYGVGKAFVRPWSMYPRELLSLVVPRAVGGISQEEVIGARRHGFPSELVGTYWGNSFENSSYYYAGLVLLVLMALGIVFARKERHFLPLLLAAMLMVVWALGTFSEPFYSLCYAIVPFFKNFRTPPTSLALLYVVAPILAVLSLQALRKIKLPKQREASSSVLIVLGAFLVFGILLFVVSGSMSYEKFGQRLEPNQLEAMIGFRRDMFQTDLYLYGAMLLILSASLFGYLYRKISFDNLVILLLVLAFADFALVSSRYTRTKISAQTFVDNYLPPSEVARFFLGDPTLYRVVPFDQQNYGLPYYVQTFGGGENMQMSKLAFEVTKYNLYQKIDGRLSLNWNTLDMMNVKYIVSRRELPDNRLNLEHTDTERGLFTYRYKFDRPRGFFVDYVEEITSDYDRLERMNDPQLDLRRIALLEEPVTETIEPASRSEVQVISFSPNEVAYTVNAERQGLFVMSEIYAPDIQEVYLDGEPVDKVYKTNHLIQAIVVPEGQHSVEIRYKSSLFKRANWISNISLLLLYVALGWLWYRHDDGASWRKLQRRLARSNAS